MRKLRVSTRSPRLIKERDKIILALRRRGFYLDEIGQIVRLMPPMVSKILKKLKRSKNK